MNTAVTLRRTVFPFQLVLGGLLFLALTPAGTAIGQPTMEVFSSPGITTFTVPAGVTQVTVECWGAGGRGSARNSSGNGGGGGGGAYARKIFSVNPFDVISYKVGAGSVLGGLANGDSSWFMHRDSLRAVGGAGLGANISVGAMGGQASSCVGTFIFSGGNGADGAGSGSNSVGGGGGSSAGTAQIGANGMGTAGGIAPTGGGNGGNGGTSSSSALTGLAPGGGGGGARQNGGGLTAGGPGAHGRVAITYTVVIPLLYSRASGQLEDDIWSDTPGGAVIPGAPINDEVTLVIQDGHAVSVNNGGAVNNLTVEVGGVLLLEGGTFEIYGDAVTVDGAITGDENGELSLVGDDATDLGGSGTIDLYNLVVQVAGGTDVSGTLIMRGTMLLENGVFDATNANVILRSTATGTGRLGPVPLDADYVGNLTMERYIPGGATNWRLLGSPVGGRTVADWNDDFFTAGFAGSNYPPFYVNGQLWPSIRWFDEPIDSLRGVAGTGDALTLGKGFAVWSGDALGGTSPFLVDVTGPPTVGHSAVILPMTYTNNGNPNDGLNLVSNPLPSEIDFANVSRGDDVSELYYIYDPASGNTAAWDGLIGTNGATGIIQSSQAFWLMATGPNVTTSVTEDSKTNNDSGGLFGGQQAPLPMLRLAISSSVVPYHDETVVLFQDGSAALDEKDIIKFPFAHPQSPQIATRSSDGHDLAINRFGEYTSSISIPVMVDVAVGGTYTITATDMSGLDGLSCLVLEDLLTGVVLPLAEGASMNFASGAGDNATEPRFLLHASAPVPFMVADAMCAADLGYAEITVIENDASISVFDANAVPVVQEVGLPAGMVLAMDLAAGSYELQVSTAAGCGTLIHPFSIAEPSVLEVMVELAIPSCPGADDAQLQVAVTGGSAPYTYLWSTGGTDASIAAGAGTFSVVIADAAGCQVELTDLTVDEPTGPMASFSMSTSVLLVNEPVTFVNTGSMAESYLWNFGDGAVSTEEEPTHSYALPGTYLVTLTIAEGSCGSVATGTVLVELGTGINAAQGIVGPLVWSNGNDILVDHPYTKGMVHVEVLDATGRLHIQQQNSAAPGQLVVSVPELSTGIWFVRITNGDVQRTFRVPLVR